MTKNGQSRSVVLNNKSKDVLGILANSKGDDVRTKNSDYLFPSRTGARKHFLHDLRKPFLKVCIAADIDNLRIHDLRHSFASFAVMAGASLYDVQKLLGHSDISMTQRYSHLPEANLRKASDNVSRIIDQVING